VEIVLDFHIVDEWLRRIREGRWSRSMVMFPVLVNAMAVCKIRATSRIHAVEPALTLLVEGR